MINRSPWFINSVYLLNKLLFTYLLNKSWYKLPFGAELIKDMTHQAVLLSWHPFNISRHILRPPILKNFSWFDPAIFLDINHLNILSHILKALSRKELWKRLGIIIIGDGNFIFLICRLIKTHDVCKLYD